MLPAVVRPRATWLAEMKLCSEQISCGIQCPVAPMMDWTD